MIGSFFDDFRGAARAFGLLRKRVLGFRKRPKLRALGRLAWKGLDIPRRERYFAAQTQRVALRQALRGRKIQRAEIEPLREALRIERARVEEGRVKLGKARRTLGRYRAGALAGGSLLLGGGAFVGGRRRRS